MAVPAILVGIPSLHGGPLLAACLAALARQTERDFEVIVVDNSGSGAIERELQSCSLPLALRVFRSPENLGFGGAINQAWGMSGAHFLATLNDDAEPHEGWLAALRAAMTASPDIGMCASQVRMGGTGQIDSAGMLIYGDGSSKQRGHGQDFRQLSERGASLFPSASAALYRREMLDDVGLFDADFFLYCEDTDLGLRARRNGWECVYVPHAVVEHHYSQSSGEASALKAWYVERNRLWMVLKNFPFRMLVAVPWYSAWRYFWHFAFMARGRGTAGRFRAGGGGISELVGMVWRAHWQLIRHISSLRQKRRRIRRGALITDKQFVALLKSHAISAREIARL